MGDVGISSPDIISSSSKIQSREAVPSPHSPTKLTEPIAPHTIRYGSSEEPSPALVPISPSSLPKSSTTSLPQPRVPTVGEPVPVNTYDGLLTERQAEIFALNRQGLSNEVIAGIFNIPSKSVVAYIGASQKKLRESGADIDAAQFTLTPAQTGTLMLAAKGKTYNQIASEVGISQSTVKILLEQARTRLNDSISTEEAIIKALDMGIISPIEVLPDNVNIPKYSSKVENLPPRQREIYNALVEGEGHETYKQIGYRLKMSEQNIKNYASSLWNVLGITNRAQAIVANRVMKKANDLYA